MVVIERIYSYQFNSNYLKNRKPFTLFWLNICNLHVMSNVLQKKISPIDQVFLKLLTPKYVVFEIHKRPSFWKRFGSELVN